MTRWLNPLLLLPALSETFSCVISLWKREYGLVSNTTFSITVPTSTETTVTEKVAFETRDTRPYSHFHRK